MFENGRPTGRHTANDYNRWLKRLAISHQLQNQDIAEVMRLGGSPVSTAQAGKWMRSTGSDSFVKMTEHEFDVFTNGLVDWAKAKRKRVAHERSKIAGVVHEIA